MQRFRTQGAVARQAEGAEPLRAFPAGDVQGAPPQDAAERRRKLADEQGLAEETDLRERLLLVEIDRFLEHVERLQLGCAEKSNENPLFAVVLALECQR